MALETMYKVQQFNTEHDTWETFPENGAYDLAAILARLSSLASTEPTRGYRAKVYSETDRLLVRREKLLLSLGESRYKDQNVKRLVSEVDVQLERVLRDEARN